MEQDLHFFSFNNISIFNFDEEDEILNLENNAIPNWNIAIVLVGDIKKKGVLNTVV